MTASLLEVVKDLVIAQMETRRVSTSQAVQLLKQTHTSLLALQREEEAGALNQEVEGFVASIDRKQQ